MKKTKHSYHYAVRKLKRDSEMLRKRRMAEAVADNKSRDFWSEVKKVNGKRTNYPINVENKTNAFDIASLFAAKYDQLYNSVPANESKMKSIKHEINIKVNYESTLEMKIDNQHVCKAIKSIKMNKADGDGELFSNHIMYAPPIIYNYISCLFNGMISHGYTPKCLLNSTIISIPKDVRGNLSSGENYRGIALCSSLYKLFELVLIQVQGHKLDTSDMQYAYKHGHSTTMATTVLKDTVNHFITNGSSVYCCFIDASKAFDRLRHDLLFELLLQRNVNPLLIRILIESYERQTVQTSWSNTKSDKFNCKNGVRQGGILSPLLYTIYNDVLLNRLKDNGYGCWIGDYFYGAISYADDLCILSPTIAGLQEMLNVCTNYGKEYDVMFNPKKTQCLKFSKNSSKDTNIYVKLCDQQLSWVNSFKYLGNWVSNTLSEDIEIDRKLGVFFGNVNNLKTTFRNIGRKNIFILFNCCSIVAVLLSFIWLSSMAVAG